MQTVPGLAFTEKLLNAFARRHWLLQWLIVSIAALVLYAPIIGNSFVNDDFLVLKKVCIDGQLNTKGFFRPLSDITLYGNYLLAGFDPVFYHITNIIVHALNSLLLFHFCLRWPALSINARQPIYAAVAALLFLTYPFHNEPVVWSLGRASLLAGTFAFLALVCLVSNWREPWKLITVAICYYVALSGYESVMVLPGIVFVWSLSKKAPVKRITTWMMVLALTLAAHFVTRILVSGSVTGDYGSNFLGQDWMAPFGNAVKVTGRLFLPPVKDPVIFLVLLGIIVVMMTALVIKFWKKTAGNKSSRAHFLYLGAALILSLLLPFMTGLSTNTSESDRFLYVPSFFFCAMGAFLLLHLLYNRYLIALVAVILVYNIVFLTLNNLNWRKASAAVTGIIDIVKQKRATGNLYIVNMPDQIDGAYVFRVGFTDALLVNQLDTASVKLVNAVEMRDLEKIPVISHQSANGTIFIPPAVELRQAGKPGNAGDTKNKNRLVSVTASDQVVYWNKHRWVLLQ